MDRESAYEMLAGRVAAPPPAAPADAAPAPARKSTRQPKPEPGVAEQILGSSTTKRVLGNAATAFGRELVRSVFGTRKR